MELDQEDIEDLEESPESEIEKQEERVLDQATAAQSIHELKAEIETIKSLESTASEVLRSGGDTKWRELAALLNRIFTPAAVAIGDSKISAQPSQGRFRLLFPLHSKNWWSSPNTGHSQLLAKEDLESCGKGRSCGCHSRGMRREDRHTAQESFRHDPTVQILLATDAAGEGINLQRAHLMVNYDLPWNPNRIEQRFGRIHRIGQTQVCHLWNLVAEETREGDVYLTLLEKLEQARKSLGARCLTCWAKSSLMEDAS